MNRKKLLLGCGCIVLLCFSAARARDYSAHIVQTDPLTPEQQRARFKLPPGFEIQLVASEPEIRMPINIAFDQRGRLWVAQSIDYPFPAKDEARARDTVKILDDFAPDGRARRITTFADKLTIPIGVLPTQQGAIIFSIPTVYHMIDSDGDGRADRREKLLTPFAYDDTHGLVNGLQWGFDGWVYACHGFRNVSRVTGTDGRTVELHGGGTFRFRVDGTGVEEITQGRVNPFGMDMDAWERFYSADCHSRPVYELIRGAWYPGFGTPHDGLGFGPEICDHDHGSTAIAGLAHYAGQNFPEEYAGAIFTGNVITNRVNQDRLQYTGATAKAVHHPDFVVCDDGWFRPVDLIIGPDGALYIADFYTRIIGHYEVPLDHPQRTNEYGRIWRVVYRGPDGKGPNPAPPADLTKATLPELIALMGHRNVSLRLLVNNELVERIGRKAVAPVREVWQRADRPEVLVDALWVLERLGALGSRLLNEAARHPEAMVRMHAMAILRERPTWNSDERMMAAAGTKDDHAMVLRAAVEAIARHIEPDLIAPLFKLRARVSPSDPQLIHAVRIAIRDQFLHGEAWARWEQDRSLHAHSDVLADVSLGIPSERAAVFLLNYMQDHEVSGERLRPAARHVARYLPEKRLGETVKLAALGRGELSREVELLRGVFEGLGQRGAQPTPELKALAEPLAHRLLDTGRDQDFNIATELARTVKLEGLQDRLAAIAANTSLPEPRRRAACDALVAIRPAGHLHLLSGILGDGGEAFPLREHAARLIGNVGSEAAATVLMQHLTVAPADLAVVIARAVARSHSGAQKLLHAIAEGKASAFLLTDREVADAMNRAKVPDVKERIAALTEGLPSADEQVRRLMAQRREGFLKAPRDPRRGAAVFEKTCAVCHRIGNVGAKIGPELDGIGLRGLDRLLEDTLEPSRNVDRAFRQTVIELEDGTMQVGLRQGEQGETILLADAQGQILAIPRNSVKEEWTSTLSPMPSDVAANLPEEDLYDLLAFLLAQRETAAASQPATQEARVP